MKTVAVIFGGRSTEHDVSIVTALASIIKPLELTKEYNVEAVYISKNGQWFWDEKLKNIELFRSGEIDEFMHKASKVHIGFDSGFTLVKSSQFAGRKQYKKIDVVFPSMHGTHGEDGELMGILEMANVPYVGCDVTSSAIAMDKVLAKQVTESAGIPSTPWTWFYSRDLGRKHAAIVQATKDFSYPLFVKPAHLGSSIGITRVEKPDQLTNALEVAAHYDNKVIIEQGVQHLTEVTLPIIGNEEPVPALLEQPLLQPEDFFDFETKYMSGGKKGGGKKTGGTQGSQGYSKIPAEVSKDVYDTAVRLALDTYTVVGCTGIARIDMLINSKTNQVFFNEINPMPGSLYAHNWQHNGVSSVELVSRLITYAEKRWEEKQRLATVFSTNFLKQF